ncbi:MAG TPA: hypothetical protein VF011_21260 [Terriglobales bacterium]
MIRAKVINACFQVMAAFWAVIVITKTPAPMNWRTYALAAAGVVVISVVGTRLKHRILKRQNPVSSGAASVDR